MRLRILGNDSRAAGLGEYIEREGARLPWRQATVLPIPSTRDGKTVAGTDVSLGELVCLQDSSSLLVGYAIPEWVASAARARGAEVLDAAEDETFLTENAGLTAEATVRILSDGDVAPSDLRIGIIGYGRIGKFLKEMLTALGASVEVYSSREGFEPYPNIRLARACGVDVLINTAPAAIIKSEWQDELSGIRIMELASGKNIPDGFIYESLPSLPYRVYPKSAARTFIDFFKRQTDSFG